MAIIIEKAKLLKDDKVEISYTRHSTKHKPSKVGEEHNDPAHPDFKKAFEKLAIHAAVIAEFIPSTGLNIQDPQHEDLKNYTVTSFSTFGENEGVNLTAMKTLKNGKMMLFNCPLIRYGDLTDNAYLFTEELKEAVDNARTEAQKYLDGKFADDAQMELPFENKPKKDKSTVLHILDPAPVLPIIVPQQVLDAVPRLKEAPKTKEGFKRVKQTAENRDGLLKD